MYFGLENARKWITKIEQYYKEDLTHKEDPSLSIVSYAVTDDLDNYTDFIQKNL